MERLARIIDTINEGIGRAAAWLTLIMVVLQFVLVLLRYAFGLSDRAWEELLLYFHGTLFLLAASYTLQHNGHVRVDLLYRDADPKAKARINLFGTLFFLLPICELILWAGWPFVAASWQSFEGSTETSGLPFKYLYKSLILVFAALVALQSVAQVMKSLLILAGNTSIDEEEAPVL
jgi:TRAP-type mannitol/chloroaromatic compound transport system permease small subunit